jgi:UDP-3-O-[3-hydroxymyristoyl] glucosamine N-acyltransferase
MKFTLKDIEDFLVKTGYDFSIKGEVPKSNGSYSLSSSRNKIDHGLYYFTAASIEEADQISNSILLTDASELWGSNNIIITVKYPQLIHYKLALSKESKINPSIHPTAIINPKAQIAASAHIGPFCIIEECLIGENVSLLGHITVNNNCEIRANSIIESHSVIGARGMAWIWDESGNRVMQPQIGGVIIEEDCILGTGIAIVRGSLNENTIIGKGTVMAHGTKIGHGCIIGKHVHFANNVSIAGNATIGDRVFLGSGCVVSSNVTIGEGCIIGAGAVVHKSIMDTYCTIAGVPAVIIKRNNFESKPKGAPKPYHNKIKKND